MNTTVPLNGQEDHRFDQKFTDKLDAANLGKKIRSHVEKRGHVRLSPGLRIGSTMVLLSLRSNGQMHMALPLQMYHGGRKCLCWFGEIHKVKLAQIWGSV